MFLTGILLTFITNVFAYSPIFHEWQCVGIKERIDFSKPYTFNVGELPLVLWKDAVSKRIITTLNICKHMGSALDKGKLTDTGCLKCPYHGLEFSYEDRFGETMEHEGKLFWAYKPVKKTPYNVPFFNNPQYVKSFVQIDMDGSLTDSAYNTMDLRHPEYVHSQLAGGFGNSIPPTNVKHYTYKSDPTRVGLSFDYVSNPVMRAINGDAKVTHNYHMFQYPTFSWSKVTFENKHLMIGVNLLPIAEKKTRWFITVCHNYYTSDMGQRFVNFLASTILGQDSVQMKLQAKESALKRAVLFEHIFKDEEPILYLRQMLQDYKYPDIDSCAELYKDFQKHK